MWCCIRHFDLRIVNDCNVVDSEATAMHGEPAASTVAVAAVRPPRTPASRLLLACIKDPITLPDVGKHITSLQGATQAEERIKLLQSLASMQLWEVREGRRLPGADMRSVSFHRFPLSPTLRATLQHLDVPESFWPVPQSCPTAPRDQALPSQTPTAAPPPMRGAGKRARPPDAAAEDAKKGRGRPSAKEVDDLYSLQATLPCEEDISKEQFLKREKAWPTSLIAGHTLRIRSQFAPFAHGFRVHLWCSSCDTCKNRQGWIRRPCACTSAMTSKYGESRPQLLRMGISKPPALGTLLTSTAERIPVGAQRLKT